MGARWTCERERNSCIYSFFLLLCAVQPSAEQSKAKQHSRYQAKLKMSDTSLRFVLTRCLELLSVLQLWCVWLNNQIVQRIDLHSLSQHHFASVCTIAWNELNRRTKKTDNENETKKNKKLDKLRVKVTNVPIDTEHTTHTHKHYIAVSGAILLLRRKTKKKTKNRIVFPFQSVCSRLVTNCVEGTRFNLMRTNTNVHWPEHLQSTEFIHYYYHHLIYICFVRYLAGERARADSSCSCIRHTRHIHNK